MNNEPLLHIELNVLDTNRQELNSMLHKLENINKFLNVDVLTQLYTINPGIIENLINDHGFKKLKEKLIKIYAQSPENFEKLFLALKTAYENENKIEIINNVIMETCDRYDIDMGEINSALLIDDDFKRNKKIEKMVKGVSIFGRLKWSTEKGLAEFERTVDRLDKKQELENAISTQNVEIGNLINLLHNTN
jgi:hypothetical protein